MKYSPQRTAGKAAEIGGIGSVGIIAEIIVEKKWPGLFPGGTLTAALTTLWVAFQNWRKNK